MTIKAANIDMFPTFIINHWRKQFIDLSEEIFRELGFPAPIQIHEETLPLAMELVFEGYLFEIIHSPAALSHCILVRCKLGEMPKTNEKHGMYMLLKENLCNLREYSKWYGVDSESDEVVLNLIHDLEGASALIILQRMRRIVNDSRDWQTKFFDPDLIKRSDDRGRSKSILV